MDDLYVRISPESEPEIRQAEEGPRLRVLVAHTGITDLYRTRFGMYRSRARVPMARYNHGNEPLWIGRIDQQERTDGNYDVFWEGAIIGLDIPEMRHQWDLIREMGRSQQWSYRFRPTKRAVYDEKDDVIDFPEVELFEVAPVYRAGTEGTKTVFARSMTEFGLSIPEKPEIEVPAEPEERAERPDWNALFGAEV